MPLFRSQDTLFGTGYAFGRKSEPLDIGRAELFTPRGRRSQCPPGKNNTSDAIRRRYNFYWRRCFGLCKIALIESAAQSVDIDDHDSLAFGVSLYKRERLLASEPFLPL